MSNRLDREGIFMARAQQWSVRTFETSQAVAINIEFLILGQLNQDGGWDDWRNYDEHTCWGMFFITKKDGTVNAVTVEQLARSLGWSGDLQVVANTTPPRTPVQITVKGEEYRGTVAYKASWINPKDYTPSPHGASDEEVGRLQARFGSLLRAAAAAAAREHVREEQPSGLPPEPEFTPAPPAEPDDDLPF